MTLRIVQDEAADELLSTNPFALLCGMLLLQHVPIEVAFAGPARILDRFGSLDPASVGAAPDDEFAKLCATEPAIHPYPESMAVLIQAVARYVVGNYGGDAAAVWETAESGKQLLSRLTILPGFGKRQAQEFVALLGKQLGVRPPGWDKAAGPFAQAGRPRSVADVRDAETLRQVQASKSRRRDGDGSGDLHNEDRTRSSTPSSKGAKVKSDEEKAEKAERVGARKAARKGAKRAANKALKRQQSEDAEVGVEGAEADSQASARAAAKRPGLKAKKAAKRAAKRAARAADPDAPAKKGAGRSADGSAGRGQARKKAAREARKQAAAAAATGEASDGDDTDRAADESAGSAPGDAVPAGESSATPDPAGEAPHGESTGESSRS